MASGKKDYFRHSFHAHNDIKLCNANKEDIFHYWVLLELCGQQCHDGYPKKFKLHIRNLCLALRLKKEKIRSRLESLEGLFLISSLTVAENQVELVIPNFPKYLGYYPKNDPLIKLNKIKGKEREQPTAPQPPLESSGNILTHPLGDAWNIHCGALAKIKGLSQKRIKKCEKLLKINPSLEYWIEVIKKISQSTFCLGKNEREWKGNFDWLLQEDTHLKVMEGNYKGKQDNQNENIEMLKKFKDVKNGLTDQLSGKNRRSQNEEKDNLLEL